MIIYRVYLNVCKGFWREFGIDYPTRKDAVRAADAYRKSFPHNRYIIRRKLIKD